MEESIFDFLEPQDTQPDNSEQPYIRDTPQTIHDIPRCVSADSLYDIRIADTKFVTSVIEQYNTIDEQKEALLAIVRGAKLKLPKGFTIPKHRKLNINMIKALARKHLKPKLLHQPNDKIRYSF